MSKNKIDITISELFNNAGVDILHIKNLSSDEKKLVEEQLSKYGITSWDKFYASAGSFNLKKSF